MNAIGLDRLFITGDICYQKILELSVIAKVNDHAFMRVFGIIDSKDQNKYETESFQNASLALLVEEESKKYYFSGYIQSAKISYKNRICYIESICISGSTKFDSKIISRSFQNVQNTYSDIIKQVAGKNRNIVVIDGKTEEIEKPIIQYKETDWEFVKRMASHFNTVVIPEITNLYPQISFGIVNGKRYKLNNQIEYEIKNDLNEYRNKKIFLNCNYNDFITIKIKSYNNYNLGDKIEVNKQIFIVVEKKIKLVHSHLEITYKLGQKNAYGLSQFYNQRISGLSLEGTVLWTRGEKLKLHLNIDEVQNESEAYPYEFVPISGNIMYCMPEIGAKVSLYFPEANEKSAMAINCVEHIKNKFPDERVKHLKTPKNKKMEFRPGQLVFETGSAKTRKKLNSMQVIDDSGITLNSALPIRFVSTDGMSINSNVSCYVTSAVHMNFVHTDTINEIDISGSDIIMTAERYVSSSMTKQSSIIPPSEEIEQPNPSSAVSAALFGALPVDCDLKISSIVLGAVPQVTSVTKSGNIHQSIGVKISR